MYCKNVKINKKIYLKIFAYVLDVLELYFGEHFQIFLKDISNTKLS